MVFRSKDDHLEHARWSREWADLKQRVAAVRRALITLDKDRIEAVQAAAAAVTADDADEESSDGDGMDDEEFWDTFHISASDRSSGDDSEEPPDEQHSE